MARILIECTEEAEKILNENGISYKVIMEELTLDTCPSCGDDEFIYDGECTRCGHIF